VIQAFLAMTFRNSDGSYTVAFWYLVGVEVIMAGAGIWSLVAPESMRTRYFNLVNSLRSVRGARQVTLSRGWGWSSPAQIRLIGALAVVAGLGFMIWVIFFTTPGVAY
jgi:hypothetical protein